MCTLPAGYLGSSAIGAILVMCSFNILASKIASIFLGVCLLFTLWWAKNWLTRGIGFAFIAMIIFLWWLAHGVGLRYFVLFIGYVLYVQYSQFTCLGWGDYTVLLTSVFYFFYL